MEMYPAAPADKPEDNSEMEAETSLLPKSMFGGECKVGDTYTVKVIAIHGDELEVEPAGKKSEESNPNEPEDDSDEDDNPFDKYRGT